MSQSTTPSTPGVPAPMSSVWPPSNPSGTVIPFPLPWGATGCCPPGGMDALMKCYCDIQAASAFIGQIMIDQINNNPAVTAAIIAAIEKSGSSLPLIGVTDGSDAQPGQVGQYGLLGALVNYTAAAQTQTISLGIINPGDWNLQLTAYCPDTTTGVNISLNPVPVGVSGISQGFFISDLAGGVEQAVCLSPMFRGSFSVPTLIPVEVLTNQNATAPNGGTLTLQLFARRMR